MCVVCVCCLAYSCVCMFRSEVVSVFLCVLVYLCYDVRVSVHIWILCVYRYVCACV